MKKYLPIILIAAVALIIGAAAVMMSGDEQEPEPQNQPGTAANQTDNQPEPAQPSETQGDAVEIEIEDYAYAPSNITVKKGTTVTWTNKDQVGHTVTKEGASGPDSQLFSRDGTYSYTFNETGEFSYFCEPHPYMKGTVIVTE